MILTQEEVTAVIKDVVKDNPTNPNREDTEARSFARTVLNNERFLRISAAAVTVFAAERGVEAADLSPEEVKHILVAIKAGAELGYWLGLAEAEKRATGKVDPWTSKGEKVRRLLSDRS